VAFDVFISYASKDKIVADAVCVRLESSGIRCWIAPRDIVAGTSYGEAIIEAIHGAKVMVLVFSSNANASGHIPKEVERAVSNGVAILPFRIEDVAPGKSLDYFIGSVHWLDAMTPPMEKHLDDLAATVHKLIPAPGESGTAAAPPTVMWQHAAAATMQTAALTAAVRPATSSGGTAPASFLNSKTVWIGAAAVLVLAAVLTGMMLLRGGGSSHTTADAPDTTNPPPGKDIPSNPNPGAKDLTPAPKVTPASRKGAPPVVQASADPIVGCYQWFNNVPVTISADGTMVAGPFMAHWRLVNAERRAYTFTWPLMIETLTISPDQRSMSGGNQYGYPISGARTAGSFGLAGAWHWANGWDVTVAPNGTFTSASFRGTWRSVDASRGIYEMTWPSPVDSVTLLAGSTRISGANQYGVAISGLKTAACGGN
jgi:TIR domain